MDNDRVVFFVVIVLRNMVLDVCNKEFIGKYVMWDLVNWFFGGNGFSVLFDEIMVVICCVLYEVISKNMENVKVLVDLGGIEKLVNIIKGRGDRLFLKVVKVVV